MTTTAEKLKVELSQLSIEERAELASFLIHSLDEATDNEAEQAWDVELGQRIQEIDSGTAFGESSDTVFTRLREKYA
jgi:putative addiction module component (TIGR02574 family)